jgi:hypothetical protein
MENKDYIPSHDEDFDTLQNNVYTTASSKASQWLIASQVLSDLTPPRQRWSTAFAAYRNPQTRTPAVTQEKIDARKAYVSHFRVFVQGQLMHNPRVSDADIRSMGLPVHDRMPTPSPDPDVEPGIEVIAHAPGILEFKFGKKGKGMHGVEFRWILSETAPTDWSELTHSEFATHSPLRLSFEGHDRGKQLYFAARWENTRGVKGPWTEITMAIIP